MRVRIIVERVACVLWVRIGGVGARAPPPLCVILFYRKARCD